MIRLVLLLLVMTTSARADFVLSNLRMTLYHEMAHAVIDQHEIPLHGPEETAADTFALVLADRLHSEADLRKMMIDSTAMSRIEAQADFFDAWAEYMPPAQRIAYAICVYYGLNPALRRQTALTLGLPLSRVDDCEDRGESVRAAWTPLLDSIAPTRPTVSLKPARIGKAIRLLGRDIDRLNAHVTLPRPIPVSSEPCGEENAFYYHWDERIVFCTEMVEALLAQARAQ